MASRSLHRRFTPLLATLIVATSLAVGSAAVVAVDDRSAASELASEINAGLRLARGTLSGFDDGFGDLVFPVSDPTDAAHVDGGLVVLGVVDRWRPRNDRALAEWQGARRTNPIIGSEAGPFAGDSVVVVAFQTAAPFQPGTPGGMVFNIGFDGPEAAPLYGGGAFDHLAGERIVVIGGFFDGVDAPLVDDTSLIGYRPGQQPEYHGLPATASGLVAGDTYVIVHPLPDGARTASITLIGGDGSGQLIDQLTPPNGIPRLDLLGPADVPDGFCGSVGIYPEVGASGEVTGHQVEISLGGLSWFEQIDDVSIRTVTSDEANEPAGWSEGWGLALQRAPGSNDFPGTVQVFREGDSAYVNWVVPPDVAEAWLTGPAPADGDAALIDPALLFGMAPLLFDGVHAGIAIGDAACGRVGFGRGLCTHVDGPGFDAIREDLGIESIVPFVGPDGTNACALLTAGSTEPFAVVAVSGRPSTEIDWRRRVDASDCSEHHVDMGAAGALIDCDDGLRTLFWLEPFTATDEWGLIFSMSFLPGNDGSTDLAPIPGEALDASLQAALEALAPLALDDVDYGGVSLSVDF